MKITEQAIKIKKRIQIKRREEYIKKVSEVTWNGDHEDFIWDADTHKKSFEWGYENLDIIDSSLHYHIVKSLAIIKNRNGFIKEAEEIIRNYIDLTLEKYGKGYQYGLAAELAAWHLKDRDRYVEAAYAADYASKVLITSISEHHSIDHQQFQIPTLGQPVSTSIEKVETLAKKDFRRLL